MTLCLAAPASLIAQVMSAEGSVEPALLYDHEFAADPGLVARPDQGLVFTADPAQGSGRLRLSAGRHQICANGGGGHLAAILLQAPSGHVVVGRLSRQGCAQVHLSSGGVFSVRLQRDSGFTPPPWATAVVRSDPPSPTTAPAQLVGPNNSPIDGYWAIQDTTINARGTFGNRMLSTTPGPNSQLLVDPATTFDGRSLFQLPQVNGPMTPALPESPTEFWSVFFSQPYIVATCAGYCGDAYSPEYYLQIADLGNYAFTFDIKTPLEAALVSGTQSDGLIHLTPTFSSSGGDDFQVLFRFRPEGYPPDAGQLQNGEVALYQGCQFAGKSSVFIPLLGAGIVSPPYNLTALTSSTTTLDGTAKSALVGPGSSFYWGSSASSPVGAVVSNTACLAGSPSGNLFVEPLANTLIVAHSLLNNSCVGCVLTGQSLNLPVGSPAGDFSHWNLTGANFSHSILNNVSFAGANLTNATFAGATLTNVDLSHAQLNGGLDFSGATLTNVTFAGADVGNSSFTKATLSGVNFSGSVVSGSSGPDFTGATLNQVNITGLNPSLLTMIGANLCGVSLTGADANHLLNLSSGNFAGAHVTLSSSCAANLSYTVLVASAATAPSWAGLNLTGTVVNGLSGTVLSTQAAPLDLSSATLTGVSLQNAILDYAIFAPLPDLTAAQFNNASLRFVKLAGAKLYGANFANANLEGSDLNGAYLTKSPNGSSGAANLSGAFLRDVNLSQAQLSGAIFTDANFYSESAVGTGLCTPASTGFTSGCATAAGATMDGTVFDGAYLFGVDFTHTTAQGVNFGDSFLVGANFDEAVLTASAAGTDSGFSGAFLQGTNMAGLSLQNNISFRNAFVDFSQGNIIFLNLSGNNTTFAGYWNAPGEPVCAQMTYTGPTVVPVTTGRTTCPDGSQNPDGCGPAASDGSNPRWKSKVDITTVASYYNNATYTNAPASGNPICTSDSRWVPLNGMPTGPRPGRPRPPLPGAPAPTRPIPPIDHHVGYRER